MFAACLILAGCTNLSQSNDAVEMKASSQPPAAYGMVEDQKIDFILGSYHWNNTIADAPDPLGLVKNVQNAVVSPSSKVEVHFDAKTNVEELHVTRWGKDDGNQEKVSVSEHSFVLPAEPGKYVYEIVGKWSVGDGRYAVGFEVKQ
jgi:hypothetical protein